MLTKPYGDTKKLGSCMGFEPMNFRILVGHSLLSGNFPVYWNFSQEISIPFDMFQNFLVLGCLESTLDNHNITSHGICVSLIPDIMVMIIIIII